MLMTIRNEDFVFTFIEFRLPISMALSNLQIISNRRSI